MHRVIALTALAAGVLFAPAPTETVRTLPDLFGPFGAPTLALGFGLLWLALLFAWSVARTRRATA